jgi:hypothetical protein
MNNRENQQINFFNFLLVITVVPFLCKLFMMGWRRSKIATIAFILFASPALSAMSAVETTARYHILCGINPNQETCIHWKKTGIME